MAQLPIRLTQLPRPLNPKMVYDLCTVEGGMCELAVKLHRRSAEKLGTLLRRAGSDMPYTPLWTVQLFHRYPASGREYYESSLAQIAQQFSRFQIAVRKPFVVTHGNNSMVGFKLWAKELTDVHRSVWGRIREITPFSIEGVRVFPFTPAIIVGRHLEEAVAEKMFIAAKKAARKAHWDVDASMMEMTAVGLAVRHNGQPAWEKVITYKEEDRKEIEERSIGSEERVEWNCQRIIRSKEQVKGKSQRNSWKIQRNNWKTTESGLLLPD